ncbi:Pex19 protein [Hysterangium stoloniferum]|nr:Pex19 protein [Hysterangium stoloniferum]
MPSNNLDEDLDDLDEFAKQFAAEMEAMMRTLGNGNVPDASTSSASNPIPTIPTETEESKALVEAWERMIIQDLEGGGKGNTLTPDPSDISKGKERQPTSSSSAPSSSSAANPTPATAPDDAFQKAIRQAMEKIQDSDDALKADPQGGSAGQESLANLLSSLGELNMGGEGEDGEGLESMLESMMSELMSKEILYEPLKELDSKYPEYLATHGASLSPDELTRYTSQKERVSQLIAIFETPSYSDENAEQAVEVLRLMNEMQSYGSPPTEIMGPMPAGFELGADGLPKVPEGCIIV